MKRRKFLEASGTFAAASVILNGIPARARAQTSGFTCQQVQDRIYVMVNMFGANDTLNTVVPIQQYGIYATNRPTIAIPETGIRKYIELDTTLAPEKRTALHPNMTAFKDLYDQGKLNVVHGVGYANNNRSHFKSDDIWNTAGDSTPANFDFESGWAGELFEYRYPGLLGNPNSQMPDPPCIELGATNGSILFQTMTNNNASVLLTSNNASTYYNTLVSVGGPAPASFPVSDFGIEFKYVDDIQRLSNSYAQRIQTVFNAGNNSVAVTYPNNALANQLKTVARLIKGGSKSSMYMVHQNGFDTHGTQTTFGDSTTGTHANLMTDLTSAIKAFQDDLALLGLEDRVVLTTHSEFSRTIDENVGRGTDHGGVGTMFVIGKGVQGGVTGLPIDLTKVTSRGLTDLQYDYRRVFSAVVQDFMGHGPQPMAAARMNLFTSSKAPVIKATHISPVSCYINQTVLPLSLLSFTASLLPDGNGKVKWETSSEVNCKNFEVMHSLDGISWKGIGIVNCNNNNSTTVNRYELIHEKPQVGRNLYQLLQFDLSGAKRTYGPITLMVRDSKTFTVSNYPNPSSFDFNIAITTDKAQQATIRYFDVQGHLLGQQAVRLVNGFNKVNVTPAQFKQYKGQMIIHIVTDTGIEKTLKHILL